MCFCQNVKGISNFRLHSEQITNKFSAANMVLLKTHENVAFGIKNYCMMSFYQFSIDFSNSSNFRKDYRENIKFC